MSPVVVFAISLNNLRVAAQYKAVRQLSEIQSRFIFTPANNYFVSVTIYAAYANKLHLYSHCRRTCRTPLRVTMSVKTINGLFFQTPESCQYLPLEIVTKILFTNSSSSDLRRYAKVCKLWRCAIFSELLKNLPREICDSDEAPWSKIFNVNIAPRYVGRALEYRALVHKTDAGPNEEWSSIYTTNDFSRSTIPHWGDVPAQKTRSLFVTTMLRDTRDIIYTFDVNLSAPHYSSRCQIIDLCKTGVTDKFISTIRPPIFVSIFYYLSTYLFLRQVYC